MKSRILDSIAFVVLFVFVILCMWVFCGCEKEMSWDDPVPHDVRVWTDSGNEFFVLVDNPNGCDDIMLYEGYGPYDTVISFPDWGRITLIAQLKAGNCDTISAVVDGVRYDQQISLNIQIK